MARARTKKKVTGKKTVKVEKEAANGEEEMETDTSDVPEASAAPKYGVKELLTKAEECFSNFQLDLAEKFCEKALSLSANEESALILCGEINVEKGEIEKAKTLFQKAIQHHPDSPHFAKYLENAQLEAGNVAEQLYLKGLEVMEKLFAETKSAELKREISEACCAIGELYLTDLCEEEDAERKCEEIYLKGIKADASNPTAHQGLANCYISSQKFEEAKKSIEASIALWLPQFTKAIEELAEESEEEPSDYECPLDFEKRKQCAQLLIELELYEEAEKVIDTLSAENEDNIEVWYMYGWLNYLRGEEFVEQAKAFLNNVLDLSSKQSPEDQELSAELVAHSKELIAELESAPMDSATTK